MITSGITYIHEHIYIDLSYLKNTPDTCFDDKEALILELKNLKKLGVNNILDVTNMGMGRNISYMEEIAKKTEMNIIYSTGFYQETFHPPYLKEWDEKKIYAFILKELLQGMDDTPIKAQVIGEIGSSENLITTAEELVFQASIKAHIDTGAALSTHTSLGTMGHEQVKLFKKHTKDLSRIIIGHCDLAVNEEYIQVMLDEGVNIAFDTIGKSSYKPEKWRLDTLFALIQKGYQKQIVLSMDITRKSHLKTHGGLGYSYLLQDFIPMLKEKGTPQTAIDDMLIYNPKRILESS